MWRRVLACLVLVAASGLVGYGLGVKAHRVEPGGSSPTCVDFAREGTVRSGRGVGSKVHASPEEEGAEIVRLRRALAESTASQVELKADLDRARRALSLLRAKEMSRMSESVPIGDSPAVAQVHELQQAEVLERRTTYAIEHWKELLGSEFDAADHDFRGVFAEFYAILRPDRRPNEIRDLCRPFRVGYETYKEARARFDERAKYITDAVELKRASAELREAEVRIYEHVLPQLSDDERQAFDGGPSPPSLEK